MPSLEIQTLQAGLRHVLRFCLGALLGGCRPHSSITIKLSDVQLLSEEDAGQRLHKLPAGSCLEVEFCDELSFFRTHNVQLPALPEGLKNR